MKRLFGVFVFAFVTLLFSTPVQALEFGVRGYYWFPGFKGDLKASGGILEGTEVNVKDDLALGYKAYPAVEAFAGLGKQHVSLTYMEANYTAGTFLPKAVNFHGVNFPKGTAVDTGLRIRILDLAYQYDLINRENILAGFSLGVIGKIKYLEGEASMASGALKAEQTVHLPIPMVGLGAHIGLLANILEARAQLTGISYSNNYLYEAAADLSLTPFPLIDLHGGYKIIKLHVDAQDIYLNSEFSGPYLAITVGF